LATALAGRAAPAPDRPHRRPQAEAGADPQRTGRHQARALAAIGEHGPVNLPDDEREFCAWARELAVTELLPLAEQGEEGRINRPLLKAMGRLGLLRALFGGAADSAPQDAAATQLCLLRETIAAVSTDAETALALQGLGSYPILQSGTPETVR